MPHCWKSHVTAQLWMFLLKLHFIFEKGGCPAFHLQLMGPRGLGIWGGWLFIFRELGSTGNYFRGAREQANNFGDIGSLAKKQIKIRKSLHFV